jgi:hypothetical protein
MDADLDLSLFRVLGGCAAALGGRVAATEAIAPVERDGRVMARELTD